MATEFRDGRYSIHDLAEALGFQGKPITAITIEASIKELTKVTVRMLVEMPGEKSLCEVLKRYRLEPIPAEAPEEPKVKFREFT